MNTSLYCRSTSIIVLRSFHQKFCWLLCYIAMPCPVGIKWLSSVITKPACRDARWLSTLSGPRKWIWAFDVTVGYTSSIVPSTQLKSMNYLLIWIAVKDLRWLVTEPAPNSCSRHVNTFQSNVIIYWYACPALEDLWLYILYFSPWRFSTDAPRPCHAVTMGGGGGAMWYCFIFSHVLNNNFCSQLILWC